MNEAGDPANWPRRDIARALVFDPAGRLFLIGYRADGVLDPARPELRTFWFLPGGGLDPGEDHRTACRRELHEEIGVADAPIGPEVGRCEGPFGLFVKPRIAYERYFAVHLPDDRVDTSRLAETDSQDVEETRWWDLDELAASGAVVEPTGLIDLARRIAKGDVPAEPVRLTWEVWRYA